MLQQVMTAPGRISFQEVLNLRAEKGQAVVKIKETGICGSDIHAYYGTRPYRERTMKVLIDVQARERGNNEAGKSISFY